MGDGNAKKAGRKAPAEKTDAGKTGAEDSKKKKAPAGKASAGKKAASKRQASSKAKAPAGKKASSKRSGGDANAKADRGTSKAPSATSKSDGTPADPTAPLVPGVTTGVPKDTGRLQPAPETPPAPEVVPEVAPEAVPEPITIEIDRQMERLEEALERVREEVRYWARKGIYTRVRFRFRGRQVLPDIPVAAFLAAEAATFWWSGLLRALAVNVGGGALFDVELISDAEPHLARAQEHLLAGDTEDALAEFRRALDIDRDLPAGHLGTGTCLKLQGDRAGALAAFRRARRLDPHGETGRQAQVQIDKLQNR